MKRQELIYKTILFEYRVNYREIIWVQSVTCKAIKSQAKGL